MKCLIFFHGEWRPVAGEESTDIRSLREITAELGLTFESCHDPGELKDRLVHCDEENTGLAVIIDGATPRPGRIARQIRGLAPQSFILFLADSAQEYAIRRELGVAPMLGAQWGFVRANVADLRHVLAQAKRTVEQRSAVRTTIKQVGRKLAAPRPRTESRFRREMRAEHYLRSVLVHGYDAVICFGSERQVLVWNTEAEKIFGTPEREVLGQTLDQLASQPFLRDLIGPIEKAYTEKTVERQELRHQRPDGSELDLEVTATPVRDEIGEEVGVVLIARDITERLRAEREALDARDEAEEANRTKDRFLAVLSHELRTPLTPVLALLDSLSSREHLPVDIASDLQLIRRNILLETRLIDDLLDVNRIRQGKLQLQIELIDMHRTLEYAKDICRPAAAEKSIELLSDLQAVNIGICGDLARIQQIFWNLIQNAVKFTPPGGSVTVRTRNVEPGKIEVSVQDTGAGIPPEVLPKVFDPFEQGATSVTRKFGGLGLGLAICKALVEAHGGSITASSAGRNKGATFVVTMNTAREEECAKATVAARSPEAVRKGLHILLVEDHDDTRGTLQRLLARRGHKVRVAAGVAEALRSASECDFDLLVTDIGLPDASGHDLMREVRKLCPRIQGIALSGFGMEGDIAASLEAGFSDHLTKPVNFQKLEEAIYRNLA